MVSWCGRSSYPPSFNKIYACESWTLTVELERRIQVLKMRCYRRLLNISYKDHVTNEEVRNRIQNAIGVHVDADLLTMVMKRKLRWYGHISRSCGMAKTILQGAVKGARRRRSQKKKYVTSRNGQTWSLEIPWGQRKTGKGGKVLLQHSLACSFRNHYRTNFVKKNLFPLLIIILKQVVGSNSQCLSPPRPRSQNLRVHYEIVPLKIKI